MTISTSAVVAGLRSLERYQTLEIKRRYDSGYEANWQDISSYLLSKGNPKITYKLDIDEFGWGEFKTGNATFKVNNKGGAFFPDGYGGVSLFNSTLSRHYTKIRFTCGYKDDTGTRITEQVFDGLLNEKSINMNFSDATMQFYAVSNQSIFGERTTYSNSLSGSKTATQIVSWIMNRADITTNVTFDSSKLSFGIDCTFDDSSVFNGKQYDTVLTDLAKRTNSAWYVEMSTNKLCFRTRTATTSPVFAFVGGNIGSKGVNIVKNGIAKYDEGYDKIINRIVYDTKDDILGKYTFEDTTSQAKYGTNQLDMDGEGMTTYSQVNSLCTGIINAFKNPKRRITVKSIYLPNVLNLFDVVSVEYYGDRIAQDVMLWNYSTWNSGLYYYTLNSGYYIPATSQWIVMGWEHDTEGQVSTWYLLEK